MSSIPFLTDCPLKSGVGFDAAKVLKLFCMTDTLSVKRENEIHGIIEFVLNYSSRDTTWSHAPTKIKHFAVFKTNAPPEIHRKAQLFIVY